MLQKVRITMKSKKSKWQWTAKLYTAYQSIQPETGPRQYWFHKCLQRTAWEWSLQNAKAALLKLAFWKTQLFWRSWQHLGLNFDGQRIKLFVAGHNQWVIVYQCNLFPDFWGVNMPTKTKINLFLICISLENGLITQQPEGFQMSIILLPISNN